MTIYSYSTHTLPRPTYAVICGMRDFSFINYIIIIIVTYRNMHIHSELKDWGGAFSSGRDPTVVHMCSNILYLCDGGVSYLYICLCVLTNCSAGVWVEVAAVSCDRRKGLIYRGTHRSRFRGSLRASFGSFRRIHYIHHHHHHARCIMHFITCNTHARAAQQALS